MLAAEEGMNYRGRWKQGDHQEVPRIFQLKDDDLSQGGDGNEKWMGFRSNLYYSIA